MPKWLSLSVVIGLVIMINSGCSKKEKGSPENRKVIIRYANSEYNPSQVKLMREIIDEFNKKNFDIKVVLEFGQGRRKIIVQMAGKSAPDVFYWGDVTELVGKGVLEDLSPYLKKYNLDTSAYFPFTLEAFRFGNKLYALPLHFSYPFLVYNKNIFDKAGFPYPNDKWTWDDYFKAAKSLTKDFNEDGKRDQFGTIRPYWLKWLQIGGVKYIDTETMKCTIDSPQAKESLKFLLKLDKETCPNYGETQSMGGERTNETFSTGRVAMYIADSSHFPSLSKRAKFPWDIALCPKPSYTEKVLPFAIGGLCLYSGSKHKEEAFRFMKFYCGPEGQKILAQGKNCVPADKEVAEKVFMVKPPEHIGYLMEEMEREKFEPGTVKISSWNQIVNAIISPEIDLLFLGKKDIDSILEDITEKTNKLLIENEESVL